MPNRLHRCYGAGYLHVITTSCYQRMALLGKPANRDLLLEVLERVRRRYRFVVVGYVVMPEHVHLLLGEPERGDPSKVMQAIKQGFAGRLLRKLRYIHRNPVVRGLVLEPQQWERSNYRQLAAGEPGVVLVNEQQKAELKIRSIA